jgi:hypothetical protein
MFHSAHEARIHESPTTTAEAPPRVLLLTYYNRFFSRSYDIGLPSCSYTILTFFSVRNDSLLIEKFFLDLKALVESHRTPMNDSSTSAQMNDGAQGGDSEHQQD